MNVVDPVAVAARLERERKLDAQIAALVAAEQKELDNNGEKICANSRDCAQSIPQDAKICPVCGKHQGQSASGQLSGANRTRRQRNAIVLNVGGPR